MPPTQRARPAELDPPTGAATTADPPPTGDQPGPEPTTTTIEALGADGDGIARPAGTPVFLPFTLPGERVRIDTLDARGRGTATILDPSPDRVEPRCPHFGACGGCTVQHLADAPYADWKRGLVAAALHRLGYDAPLPPLARTPPHARRRMDLAIRRDRGVVTIGLHRRMGAAIVDMHACPVLDPALFALVAALRPVLRRLDGLRREASAIVNRLDDGIDLLLRTDAPLSASDRAALATMAAATRVVRIAWSAPRGLPEPAVTLGPATLSFDGRRTPIPPGAFLQASPMGEAAIRAAVLSLLPPLRTKSRIVELFAGVGTLTHALAARASVTAIEGDAAAVQALRAAANPRVDPIQRDLVRQPMRPPELAKAAAIVLDPPFAGAGPQMAALAQAGRPIVYVSCNPAALVRDGQVLRDAGYAVTGAVAIDQFLWSARTESVVGFQR